jgi:predicted DCC family thiol-disulfide oxidoreductase YuxK
MTTEATLYHDGCNVCLSVVETITKLVDPTRVALRVINLDVERERTAEAEMQGVRRLPSLVLDGTVHEISPHSAIAEFYEPILER